MELPEKLRVNLKDEILFGETTGIPTGGRPIQIGLDDLSPRPTQGFECIDGLDLFRANKLMVDVFVPFSIYRGNEPKTSYGVAKNTDFLQKLKICQRISGSTLKYHVHGYHHSASRNNANHEFFECTPSTIKLTLQALKTDIEKVEREGIDFHHGPDKDKLCFRPPGWKINQAAVDLLQEFDYTHLSLLERYKDEGEYDLDFGDLTLHWCNAAPPDVEFPKDKTTPLSVTYHAATWLNNNLDLNNALGLLTEASNSEILLPFSVINL